VHVPVPVRPTKTSIPVIPQTQSQSQPLVPGVSSLVEAKTSVQIREPSGKRKLAEDSLKDEDAQDKVTRPLKRTKREDTSSTSGSTSSNDDEELDEDSTSSSSAPSSPLSFAVPTRGPFLCPVEHCDCRYTRRYDMKMHFLSKHPEQVPQFPEIF